MVRVAYFAQTTCGAWRSSCCAPTVSMRACGPARRLAEASAITAW